MILNTLISRLIALLKGQKGVGTQSKLLENLLKRHLLAQLAKYLSDENIKPFDILARCSAFLRTATVS